MSVLETGKIAKKYEILYYYTQKIINWEYFSLDRYMSIIYNDTYFTNETVRILDLNGQPNRYKPASISASRYMTEEMYQCRTVGYSISITRYSEFIGVLTLLSLTNSDYRIPLSMNFNTKIDDTFTYDENILTTTNKPSELFSEIDVVTASITEHLSAGFRHNTLQAYIPAGITTITEIPLNQDDVWFFPEKINLDHVKSLGIYKIKPPAEMVVINDSATTPFHVKITTFKSCIKKITNTKQTTAFPVVIDNSSPLRVIDVTFKSATGGI